MTTPDLPLLVRNLLSSGRLQYDIGYGRSELLSALYEVSETREAQRQFSHLRANARHGKIGNIYIRTTGVKRGTKYIFSEEEHSTRDSVTTTKDTLRSTAPSPPVSPGRVRIMKGDNLTRLQELPSNHFSFIYIDPPFNTGKVQARTRISTVHDETNGDRTGFQGKRYRTVKHGTKSFSDSFDDFVGFITPRLEAAYRLLTPNGSLFLHLDYREVHYAKVALDKIFGRESFINEIIWAYDYGARSKKKWSAKHDNILWYAKDPKKYTFNYDEMDRIPYMAPGLVGPEKAARGKTPTDVWWHTIVSPNGREKTGYPTQKPLGVLRRFVKVHSNPGDRLLDFFAGSGTLGEAGAELGRSVTLIDISDEAVAVMQRRLARFCEHQEDQPQAGRDTAIKRTTPSPKQSFAPEKNPVLAPVTTQTSSTQQSLF